MDLIFSDMSNTLLHTSPDSPCGVGTADPGSTEQSPAAPFEGQLKQFFQESEIRIKDGIKEGIDGAGPDDALENAIGQEETLFFRQEVTGEVMDEVLNYSGIELTDRVGPDDALENAIGQEETLFFRQEVTGEVMDEVLNYSGIELTDRVGPDDALENALDQEETPFFQEEAVSLWKEESQNRMGDVLSSSGTDSTDAAAYAELEKILGGEGGLSFLRELKQLLFSLSNGNLDKLSINQEGLDALEQVLGDAGFAPDAIEELMGELMGELPRSPEDDRGRIFVSEFIDKLFELPRDEEGQDITQTQNFMPTSDLPYIQSLLGTLGIDPGKISGIMSEASQGSSGFDLDIFVDALRQLAETSFNSGVSYQTGTQETSQFRVFEQLGLTLDAGADGPLTLNQLIQSFEQKLQSVSDRTSDIEGTGNATLSQSEIRTSGDFGGRQDSLSQLLSSLELASTDVEKNVVNTDLATTQARDHIKMDFLNRVNGIQSVEESPGKEMTVKIDPAMGKDFADPTKDGGQSLAAKANSFEVTEKFGVTGQSNENAGYTGAVPLADSEKINTNTALSGSAMDKVRQTVNSLPDYVTRQVGKNIVRAVNLGEETLRLQLKPPELGRVFMTIDNTGDTMKVSIITEHQSAKDILTANVNEIKTILSSSGISLERFEVDMSSDFRQSMADARSQDYSGRKKSGKNFGKANDGEDEDLTHVSALQDGYTTSGSLHYVA